MNMDTAIQYLPGVGPKRAELLQTELGVSTVGDLVRTYPFRYIDRSSIVRIADVHPDLAQVQVRAMVTKVRLYGKNGVELPAEKLKYNMVSRLSAMVSDESGEMEMVFFKGVKWMHARLVPGHTFIFFGKPAVFGTRLNMVHPEVDAPDSANTGILTGVYNSTEKLKTAGITGKVMLKLIGTALEGVLPTLQETLPDYILKEKGLVPLTYALRGTLPAAAVPAQAKICPQPQRRRAQDAGRRGGLQRLLQCAAVPAHQCPKARDPGNPGRHAQRPPDEPPAAGGRGLRQNHGGGAQRPHRRGEWLPGLPHGTHGRYGWRSLPATPE